MKRMIAYEEYLKLESRVKELEDANTSLNQRIEELEAKNYYSISIDGNNLVIALEEDEDNEENV